MEGKGAEGDETRGGREGSEMEGLRGETTARIRSRTRTKVRVLMTKEKVDRSSQKVCEGRMGVDWAEGGRQMMKGGTPAVILIGIY